jgi:hypothetical protein
LIGTTCADIKTEGDGTTPVDEFASREYEQIDVLAPGVSLATLVLTEN